MAEFKEIKFKGQVENYQTLKAGLKRSDLNGNSELQSIFDKIDTAADNGQKDGILDENEVNDFMQKIVEFAKGGRDKKLSKKEADKFLQSLGLENANASNLFAILNSFSNQSKNIKQTTLNKQNNSNIIEYTDGHIEEVFADGSKIITVKNGDTTTITKNDKNNKTTSKSETTVKDGVETVVEYEGEMPATKTVTDTKNKTVSTYNIENGKEILVQEENTQTGDVTTYKDGTKTTTQKDGTVIIEKDGIVKTISADGNTETIQDNNTGINNKTVFDDKNGTTTQTKTDAEGNQTILTSKDGKNVSQSITKNGQTYSVEYDGNGNTKGVTVQNGESPALIAKRFGCKVEDLISANPEAIKGKAPNQYFLVGADIVIPGEMDAEKFAKLNAGRQSKEEAIGKYTDFVKKQQAEDDELAARKNHKRTFIEQKWNTFEECAKAYFAREGVNNPTKRQIELRVKELQELNPNLKDGEIKGKKIIATFSPETDAQIGAGQQKRETARMEQKQKAEYTSGKAAAKTMYDAMDGLSWNGGVSKKEFKEALKNVNADNVVGVLKQYSEMSPDETLIEAIMDETGSDLKERTAAVRTIVDALIKRADSVNVSDERQKQAIEACKKELNSYWSLGIGYCQTSKLDGLINNLIGTIDAAEALTTEEKSKLTGNGINETLDLMNTQVNENTTALNTQLAEDGWCADLYEGLKWCAGSDNLDENVKADLETYKGYIAELQKAEQSGGESGFKAKFKEIFGVDYDPNLMKGYNKLQSNYAMAQGLTMQKDGFYSEFKTCINGQEDYNSMRSKYEQYLTQLARAEGQNINADNAVDSVIATQLSKQGLDFNKATDAQKQQALKTVISDTYNAIDTELNKYTQGRSLSNMEKQLKNAGSAVFGNKNDIAFRVNDYISSQQQGGAAVNMAVKAAGAIAIGIATGGAGFAALATASAATAALSATVDLTDRTSSDVGLKEGETANILKNAAIDGASVFAGGMAGKYAAMFKNANSFVQAGGKLSVMIAGDVATGAAAEYLQTGTITLEGVAFQAVFSAAGNLVSLKQLAKTDISAQNSGNPQSVRVSKGVKGDVNNHRDIIADAEVARNADQKHLNSNERKMIEDGLEDIPTPQEVNTYSKEIEYKQPALEEKAALEAHQAKVSKDYAEAHSLENNAVMKEQKTPPAPKEAIDKINDEIRGLDGSIKNLEQKIAGAKRFGKNTATLEKQLANLQEKRAAKVAELESPSDKANIVEDSEIKSSSETPEAKPAAEVKSEVTPESVKKSVNDIPDTDIPVEHKGLWNDCKKQIDKITTELKNFKGDVDAMLLKCSNLFADLRIIAGKANASVKNKIEQLINDMKSLLTPKNLPITDGALTYDVTPQQRMEMGQIGNSIPGTKNLDDLNKLQTWLDNMPESSQKSNLQKQLNTKYAEISSPRADITSAQDYSNSKLGTRLPKNKPVSLTGTETLKLSDYDLDLSAPEIQNKLKAMKDGDIISAGRSVSGQNDIKIDSNYERVSGKHLEIQKAGGKFIVTDMSLNGTTIGKSLANVSDEIKTTFGHQTINNIADLKPGAVKSIVKSDIEYTIENINGQIRISSKRQLKQSLNNAIKFDEIKMSNRTPSGRANPGKSMGELLTPEQKKVYSDSMDAFERSKNKKISHNANNILTTDNLLHGTGLDALLSRGGILENGLVPREISGNKAARIGDYVPDTLTPLCSDVWDVRQNLSIKDYFDGKQPHWADGDGESNFLPNANQKSSEVVIVFDKNSIDPTIMDNSFGVNNSGKSVLFENGNMSRGHDYPRHRAIPIGVPANSIDRIIVDTRFLGKSDIKALQQKIKTLGLDIKLYDLNGNLLAN